MCIQVHQFTIFTPKLAALDKYKTIAICSRLRNEVVEPFFSRVETKPKLFQYQAKQGSDYLI